MKKRALGLYKGSLPQLPGLGGASISWYLLAQHGSGSAAEEPRGPGCRMLLAQGLGTSHSTWSRLGEGGRHQLCGHRLRGCHYNMTQSTAWGTNPKACSSPFSLVTGVLGCCAMHWW